MALEELVSVVEAAKRLGGISKWTVHAWLSQGKLQRTKVGGRTMIRESELERVIQDGGKSPAPHRSASPATEESASTPAAQIASAAGAGATDTRISLLQRRRRGLP
jgi:excisionase family DNA binding protein